MPRFMCDYLHMRIYISHTIPGFNTLDLWTLPCHHFIFHPAIARRAVFRQFGSDWRWPEAGRPHKSHGFLSKSSKWTWVNLDIGWLLIRTSWTITTDESNEDVSQIAAWRSEIYVLPAITLIYAFINYRPITCPTSTTSRVSANL